MSFLLLRLHFQVLVVLVFIIDKGKFFLVDIIHELKGGFLRIRNTLAMLFKVVKLDLFCKCVLHVLAEVDLLFLLTLLPMDFLLVLHLSCFIHILFFELLFFFLPFIENTLVVVVYVLILLVLLRFHNCVPVELLELVALVG